MEVGFFFLENKMESKERPAEGMLRVTVLGSGTSDGVPRAACSCPVCKSTDPKDKRTRASILVQTSFLDILIDAGPEFRLQALEADIQKIDAVLISHPHADHIHGLDDLRPFTHSKILPIYGNTWSIEEIRERFSYVFRPTQEGTSKPAFSLHEVSANEAFEVSDLTILPIEVIHGSLSILGFRIGKFAYITDASKIDFNNMQALQGISHLIINGLREKSHPTHFTFAEALLEAEKTGAKNVFLTHICHSHSHAEIETILTERVSSLQPKISAHAAYDGLSFEVALS